MGGLDLLKWSKLKSIVCSGLSVLLPSAYQAKNHWTTLDGHHELVVHLVIGTHLARG